ncbi:FGGY-family carbohydrate kinase [Desulfosediminicola sp.]|uniref:FGGY-family carbohydrate kinase n=1 Tax=Desulfosediminicola sp. TaxID=2886825 RepID=UPI003AF2AE26
MENICRAAIEGATMVLRYGAEGMERNGLEPGEIHLVGGETESLVWRQMVADIFNQPVVSPVNNRGWCS